MKFLAPIGGFTDHNFGILTSPGTRGIPEGIKNGMIWAGDNQSFTKGFRPDKFFPWLERMSEYKSTCLFICCPDMVGNAQETINLFNQYQPYFAGWPVALVAQDGQESLEFPPSENWKCLFIGGSTVWKMSNAAVDCIIRAQALNKHIHIGRVNYWRRYQYFASLNGSERFTCDGTRTRFERTQAIDDWEKYMGRPRQFSLFVSRCHHSSEPDND